MQHMTQPSQPPSLDAFFAGGGGKSISWKYDQPGKVYGGTILLVHPATIQTDPATGEPKTKRDGSPAYQVRIDLQTNERDAQDPSDDGRRALYVGGWMTGAVGDAVRAVGGQGGPQVGGQLYVQLTERTPNDRPGLQPINKYAAQYVAPTGAEFMFNQPAQQPPAQQQAPAQQGFAQQPSAPQGFAQQPAPPQQPSAPQGFAQQPGFAPQGYPQQPPAPQQGFAPQGSTQQAPAAPQGFAPPPAQQFQPPVPSMAPGGGYAVPPGTPIQQQPPQAPGQQQLSPEQVAAQLGGQVIGQQPAQGQPGEPQRPEAMSEQAWQQMDPETRRRVAETMANNPPF